MYSPALALSGPLLETARSASRLTVVETVEEVSFELVGSPGDWSESEAVFSIGLAVEPGLIWARIRTSFELRSEERRVGKEEPLQLRAPAAAGMQAEAASMQ